MGNTLEVFFTGKFFRIPHYQRDYAWDTGNVDDLIEDVIEAIETSTSHYIGTFILARTPEKDTFHVVDGQQRLTTLTMLFHAAIHKFGSDADKIIYGDRFIRQADEQKWRLTLLNDNSRYFHDLLAGNSPERQTRSQRLLEDAYKHIQHKIAALSERPSIASNFLDTLKQLEVLEFVESDDGKAIRMFQTVNDRGKALTNIEKAKSLLIYYSNRFLEGKLDEEINDQFADIFHYYADIKSLGENLGVDVISSKRFNEDSVMRYHFLAYADRDYDYSATEDYVLDIYLKRSLKPLRKKPNELTSFIQAYVADLRLFFESFVNILERVQVDAHYYKLFSTLGISTRLYPLVIRLEARDLLDSPQVYNGLTMLDWIEAADVRVYKIRGTDPRADVSYLARRAKTLSPEKVALRLRDFTVNFMNDAEFARRLRLDVYRNPVLRHLFVEFSESQRDGGYAVEELQEFNRTQPTAEHIFARREAFPFPDHGFASLEEYNELVNTLGNLTLLEKGINSRCRNKTPAQKMREPDLYQASTFEDARRLSASYSDRSFTKDDLLSRTEALAKFCMDRWHIS